MESLNVTSGEILLLDCDVSVLVKKSDRMASAKFQSLVSASLGYSTPTDYSLPFLYHRLTDSDELVSHTWVVRRGRVRHDFFILFIDVVPLLLVPLGYMNCNSMVSNFRSWTDLNEAYESRTVITFEDTTPK
jgi:hypothetical protein